MGMIRELFLSYVIWCDVACQEDVGRTPDQKCWQSGDHLVDEYHWLADVFHLKAENKIGTKVRLKTSKLAQKYETEKYEGAVNPSLLHTHIT